MLAVRLVHVTYEIASQKVQGARPLENGGKNYGD